MSKSLNRNNEIDDRNLCAYLLDDYCTCRLVPMGEETGQACEVCRYYTHEKGKTEGDPECKWLENEVCCNRDCPLVACFPWTACAVCKFWEVRE